MIDFITLDIETLERPIPEHELEAAKAKIREKNEEQYKKPETVEAHCNEDLEKFQERWKFSRQGAKVLCVGIGIFEGRDMVDHICCPGDSEFQMLEETALDFDRVIHAHACAECPKFYTFNGSSFDLPILASACSRNLTGITNCWPLDTRQHTDLMRHPFEQYIGGSVNLETMFKLHSILDVPEKYQIEDFPDADGSQVVEMWEKDKARNKTIGLASRIVRYSAQDCWKTGQIVLGLRQVFKV
jgi:hypothetical protein